MAKKKKSALQRRIGNPRSTYWRRRADEAFMSQFRGQPCELCRTIGRENVKNTAGHHMLSKDDYPHWRHDTRNIVVLCPLHHRLGKEVAAHSENCIAVARFVEWFRCEHPARHKWIYDAERVKSGAYSYREVALRLENEETEQCA